MAMLSLCGGGGVVVVVVFCCCFFVVCHASQYQLHCDFDYGQMCLIGLPSSSFLVLNDTSDEPRQPASDVSAISER
jgi:hypothetical protein